MENSKVKFLTKDKLLISIDRLTRFKNTEVKYLRVFYDVILNNLISPKFKKSDLETMEYEQIRNWAEFVINSSIQNLGLTCDEDYLINQRIYEYEKTVFKQDKNTEMLLKNKINYKSLLSFIDESSVKNLKWLKSLATSTDMEKSREENGLLFPVKKVIIAEGATEETLLPEFARRCGCDFDKEGIYLISAGGKNQVVKLYYNLVETLNLPMFVLLDKDAKDNLEEIKPRLRDIDKIHILECGEFEDLLPLDLIKRTLMYELKNISIVEQEMINNSEPKAKILEEVFKTRGLHEFKKVEFAQMVKNNIENSKDISPEIADIIEEIRAVQQKVT